jgi:RNA recognition motif-containing protein
MSDAPAAAGDAGSPSADAAAPAPALAEPGPEPGSIYVGNLAVSTTEQELEELFAKFGSIRAIRRVSHPNGQCRGFAFVDFIDGSVVPAVIKALNQASFKGLTISVERPRYKWGDRPAGDRARGSSRTRRGDRPSDYDDAYDRRRSADDRYRERSPPRRYAAYDDPPPRREYRRERSPDRDRRGRYDDDYYR